MAQTPVWFPDERTLSSSNVVRLMNSLAIDSFDELHGWSTSDPEAFWGTVIDELDIVFEREPLSIIGSPDPQDPKWLPDALFNIVDSCLDGEPQATAVVHARGDTIEVVTFADLKERVARFANGFREAGFRPGDRVAIVMPMNIESVVAYLGTIAAGGVVVSIADSFAPDEIRFRLDISEPVLVVTQDEMQRTGKVLPMYMKCVEAGSPHCVVVASGADLELRPGDIDWSTFNSYDTTYESEKLAADAHTNILFSSGTTGAPKAIPWTQTTPIKAAMDGRFHQDIHKGDVVAWPTNLGWMMGPWLIYAALMNDAAIALFDDAPTTEGFVSFVEQAGVTMLGLVPSIVAAWRESGAIASGDWSSVRVLSSTGEASNPQDAAWLIHEAGDVPLIEYCGGTEIGGGYITSTVLHPAVPSRFTTPALGLDLVLLDDEGNEAMVGEVFLIGPSMGLSTELLNRDHAAEYFDGVPVHDKQLRRHGDQLEIEDGGLYRALGRVDDTMNLGGVKVSSAELEEILGAVESVSDVAAVAVPPPGGGPDRLVVFVVLDEGANFDTEDLRSTMQDAIKRHLNPLFRVHEVVEMDVLPRTASHKVMRRTLRAGFA